MSTFDTSEAISAAMAPTTESPSVSNNTTTASCPSRSASVTALVDSADSVLLPSIAIFGLAGNLFSIAVFRTGKLRRLASSVYLVALAASDSVFLLMLLVSSVQSLRLLSIRFVCKSVFYFLNVSGVFSAWLVVLFTAERFVVIAYPLHKMAKCSRRRARLLVLTLLPAPCLMYVYTSAAVIDVEPSTGLCAPRSEYAVLVTVLHSVEISLTYFLPALIVIVLNSQIGLRLLRSNVQRRSMRLGGGTTTAAIVTAGYSSTTTTTTTAAAAAAAANSNTASAHTNPASVTATARRQTSAAGRRPSTDCTAGEHSVTRTLVVVSTLFAALNLPHNLVLLSQFALRLTDVCAASSTAMYVATSVCYMLYYANFAANIVVYHLTSSNYRDGVRFLIGRCFRRCSSSYRLVSSASEYSRDPARTYSCRAKNIHGSSLRLLDKTPTPTPTMAAGFGSGSGSGSGSGCTAVNTGRQLQRRVAPHVRQETTSLADSSR